MTGERPALGGSELYAEWLARVERGRGRQATLSRNLSSWANYKTWSDEVRTTWTPDATPPERRRK